MRRKEGGGGEGEESEEGGGGWEEKEEKKREREDRGKVESRGTQCNSGKPLVQVLSMYVYKFPSTHPVYICMYT